MAYLPLSYQTTAQVLFYHSLAVVKFHHKVQHQMAVVTPIVKSGEENQGLKPKPRVVWIHTYVRKAM